MYRWHDQRRQAGRRHAGMQASRQATHTQQLQYMYLPEGGHEAGHLPVVLTVEIRPMINEQLHHIQMTSCCHPSKGGGGVMEPMTSQFSNRIMNFDQCSKYHSTQATSRILLWRMFVCVCVCVCVCVRACVRACVYRWQPAREGNSPSCSSHPREPLLSE